MKSITVIIFLSLLGIAGVGQNFILNSDFEENGQLKCDHWYDQCGQELTYICETNPPEPVCDVLFYQDAPSADGVWSMGVTGVGNSPPTTASTFITGLDGENTFQLNVWMKDIGNAWGGIEVGTLSEGQYATLKMIPADSGDWKFYTLNFTLSIDPSDSIQIKLWAFAAGPLFGVVNFDLVELILLDTLNNTLNPEKTALRAFPNPFNEYFIIEIHDRPIEDFTISIFSSTGQLVQTVQTLYNTARIEPITPQNGLFLYQVKRNRDQKIIGSGKFVMESKY